MVKKNTISKVLRLMWYVFTLSSLFIGFKISLERSKISCVILNNVPRFSHFHDQTLLGRSYRPFWFIFFSSYRNYLLHLLWIIYLGLTDVCSYISFFFFFHWSLCWLSQFPIPVFIVVLVTSSIPFKVVLYILKYTFALSVHMVENKVISWKCLDVSVPL